MRPRRIAVGVGIGLAALIAIVLVAVLILTNTDPGRERLRQLALDRITDMIDGEIEIGRIEGNLLREVQLIDVTIRDNQGRPFLEADTLATRFGLRGLFRQRLQLHDLRIVRGHAVLDKPPGEEWNYVRIFDTGPDGAPSDTPGWGDWVALDDVTLVDTRVTVRDEWRPPNGLSPAEREVALRRALRGDAREHVVEVAGGYQNIMEFRELDARLPRVVVAHPDTSGMAIELGTLSGLVRPFSPPPARIHEFSGQFRLVNDSLFMSGVRSELDDSRLIGGGVYALDSGDLLLIARADPISFPDLRWIYPDLPDRGGGTTWMRLEVGSVGSRVVLQQMDLAMDGARVQGQLDVTTGDTLRFGDSDVRFARVRTETLEELVEVEFPRRGQLAGRLALQGPSRSLQVDGDVRFHDRDGSASRVVAHGELGTEPGLGFREVRLRDMVVNLDPLQASLVRALLPDLPIRGTIDGTARVTGTLDLLELDADLALRDPRYGLSQVRLAGGVDARDDLRLVDLLVDVDPLRLDLLQDEIPQLPTGASATGRVVLDGSPDRALRMDGDIVLNDPASGRSEMGANGTIVFRDGLQFDDLDVRASPLQADLLRPWLPYLPAGGSVTGAMRLDGDPSGFLYVDGRLTHHHPRLGVSRFEARGGLDVSGPLELRQLALRMEPLHMALVRGFVPDLPLGGRITGVATLNGSPASRIAVEGDLTHVEDGERSHIAGRGEVTRGPGGWAAVDVRLDPLSLDVAGRFLPAAGLQGTVSGQLRASGGISDLTLDADLRTVDGGTIRAEGTLDLAAAEPSYNLDMRLQDFDLAAVTWRAPAETDLTGTMTARGRGLDPATMNATIIADLGASGVAGGRADQLRLRLALDDGLARVDSSLIRLDSAEATFDGSFGLVPGRVGTLDFSVAIDSLHAFAAWLPGAEQGTGPAGDAPPATPSTPAGTVVAGADTTGADTTGADTARAGLPATPRVSATAPSLAAGTDDRAAPAVRYLAPDGARVTETVTLVETSIDREPGEAPGDRWILATPLGDGGGEGPDSVLVDVAAGTEAAAVDSLAGSLRAEGTLRGNVTRFDLDGQVTVDDLSYQGMYVGDGDAQLALTDAGTASPGLSVDADLTAVRTAAADFDSVTVRGRYSGLRGDGTGEAVIVAHGMDDTEYRADAEFDFAPARSELRIADLTLRYDTVTWRLPEPGKVSWGAEALEVASIDLRSDAGGRIRLDGVLPVDGSGDLDIQIEDLEIEQMVALLQFDQEMTGLVDIDTNVRGTLDRPSITGTARLDDGSLDGEAMPDVRTSFRYDDQRLTADAEMIRDGAVLATAEASVPVQLSLTAGPPRLIPGDLAIDVQADSLPIEAIPTVSEQVASARGRVRGSLAIQGTTDDPVVSGDMDLDRGSVLLNPLGIRLSGVTGRLSLEGDRIVVDSLVARSGGPVRVSGEIGIASLLDPTFDLAIESRETLVINTSDVKLEVDADLSVGGSLAALEVEGEVRTREGVIYIPRLSEMGSTDVVSLHSPDATDRIEPSFLRDLRLTEQQPPMLDRMRLDIRLVVDRDVWLRSTEANVEIYTPLDQGPLHIRTAPDGSGFALEGTLSTDRGEYEFMSRRFDLTRGAATFTGESDVNPVLQIAAEHEVRLPGREAFDLRILIGGTLRDLEITLESNAQPPIAQTDLLSYLAFGRSSNTLIYRQGSTLSAQGGDAGELVGNVAGLATQQLGTIAFDAVLNDIEVDLMRELGVDVFRITPADLPPDMFTGGYGDLFRSTEVEAGRYITSRIFVAGQVNTGISRPGVRVEYAAPYGLIWQTSWRSQWLPSEPSLTEQEPLRTNVFGSFLVREWRF